MQVPTVTKIEYEVADIDGDHFPSLIQDDGSLKTDLKLPVEDVELFDELMKIWNERGDS